MLFHYDLYGKTEPMVRKMPWYDATSIVAGQGLTYGATTRGALLIDCDAQAVDFFGVANETLTVSTTDLTTGTIVYGDTIVDPFAVYKAQWDNAAANDVDVTSATTTAITIGAADDDLEGSWVYANSGTGIGQLVFIGAASTTVLTLDTTTAMTALASDTDIMLIRKPLKFAAGSGVNLDTTFVMLDSSEAATGKIAILENYMESRVHPFEPLRPRRHHALTGLNNVGVLFHSDIYPTDHLLRGATTWA